MDRESLDIKGASWSQMESSVTKVSAPSRNSRPRTKPSTETMLMKIEENATLPEVAKTLCPMVGANCRGTKTESKSRGYELGGKVLATVRFVRKCL